MLLADRERSCHLVATSSPWKGRMRLAHIQYASDWTFLTEHGPQAAWALYRRMGTAGLRLDGRRAVSARSRPQVARRLTVRQEYGSGVGGGFWTLPGGRVERASALLLLASVFLRKAATKELQST